METGPTPNPATYTTRISFTDAGQRLAYSRAIVLNSETMEKQKTFVTLWNPVQNRPGSTGPVTLDSKGLYLAYIETKRGFTYDPLIVQP